MPRSPRRRMAIRAQSSAALPPIANPHRCSFRSQPTWKSCRRARPTPQGAAQTRRIFASLRGDRHSPSPPGCPVRVSSHRSRRGPIRISHDPSSLIPHLQRLSSNCAAVWINSPGSPNSSQIPAFSRCSQPRLKLADSWRGLPVRFKLLHQLCRLDNRVETFALDRIQTI